MWTTAVASVLVLTASVPAGPARAQTPFAVLQMNLCNSGLAVASCYSFGRAVDEAVQKIHRYRPALVTLNEICRGDLAAMTGLHMTADFVPAWNKNTDDWYRCTNGELYGIALIHQGADRDVHRGWYTNQDNGEEVRAWTCTTVIAGRLTACTTHLSVDRAVALRQCHELMSTLTSAWVLPEVIVAGDFNLTVDCAPPAYDRRTDNAVQQVYFTRDVEWVDGTYEPMRWTDHPLLYETFRV
jgi:endonuclease/exonuclease/phosphatase family metal-dependent hydrolase